MAFPVRLIVIASVFPGVAWFAISRFSQDRLSPSSPAPAEHSTKAERTRTPSPDRETARSPNSTDPRRKEISSHVFADQSQQIQDAFQRLIAGDPVNSGLLRSSINRWFSENPELARKLAYLLLEGSSISVGLPDVEKNWFPDDLDHAIVWISELPPGDIQSTWMNQLGRLYTEVDPLRALSLLPTSSSLARQEEFVIQVMNRWVELDFHKAGQQLSVMPAGPIRNAAERAYLSQIIERMPTAAAAYVANEMSTESPAQEEATRLVVTRWSHLDPAAAAGWLETFPPSALKSEMIGVLMPTWVDKDPAAASAWSKRYP